MNCFYENLHNGHKLFKLSDTENLAKENISMESMTKEFNEYSQKITDLKNKIEKEINQINKLYEKVIEDLTQTYIKKHEQLLKEENELKEKLDNEVTKTKEKLENYLSEANNRIKFFERANKGIKKMENEDKNMIKVLSYISEINKTTKNIKTLFAQLMKNIKFIYEEEKNNIKYEDYYFNGIVIPNNIKFENVSSKSLTIAWSIDNLNIINIDNNKINYKIEMKKENDKMVKYYDVNNNNKFSINDLTVNTIYEFRICSIYNDLIGEWSEMKKIKTLNYDSNILLESQRENEFLQKIYEWSGYSINELIYRGTRDGMTSQAFHNQCDNQGPTLTLIKNEKGNIFGGFTSISWTNPNNETYKNAPDSFLFTLTNIYGTNPTKFPSSNNQKEINHYSEFGPTFGYGDDILINFKGNSINFPKFYQDVSGKGKSIFTGDVNNSNFQIKEIEVFKLYKS